MVLQIGYIFYLELTELNVCFSFKHTYIYVWLLMTVVYYRYGCKVVRYMYKRS